MYLRWRMNLDTGSARVWPLFLHESQRHDTDKQAPIRISPIRIKHLHGKKRGAVELVQYFGEVFAPANVMILVFGMIGGLLFGTSPGLSPAMAVELLIPFAFQM